MSEFNFQSEKIFLNDLLKINDIENTKIRLNIAYGGEIDPMSVFRDKNIERILRGQYWNYSKKSYKVGQTTICLIKMKKKEDLWLLVHVGRVTKDLNINNAIGYEYENIPEFNKYLGRVIVRYKNKSQTLIRNASSIIGDCEIVQILSNIYDQDQFPGYENINISWQDLNNIIENDSWKTALQNQKGVYLITDISNGKMYIGSAYSETMILNRWRNYLHTRHGGNIMLKALTNEHIEANFRFSILEIFKSTTSDQIILDREGWWKRTLLTREFGYNAN
ncbi:GIY-YIG nuclease family protein [Tatumella sp. OPLPL6]|uniref:GIY-YIG nuclease family protein n=1 Tax=Tatumella sp. OPLPL6 TaxID=1928657 RepID=UPI000C17D0EE|nr:GIY-YIG nuclease family protein [Tatumella sp. OPLPL6]PIJ41849.1 hypothetical protein BOM24_13755 [Tatumella sp. OPLPL6]